VRLGDVRAEVARAPAQGYDVVLLDVDNGPDFLVYDANAEVYGERFLTECRRILDHRGALTVWSSTHSDVLAGALRRVFGTVEAAPLAVDLQGRDEHYWLFTSKMME
jgi:spermidine synthase